MRHEVWHPDDGAAVPREQGFPGANSSVSNSRRDLQVRADSYLETATPWLLCHAGRPTAAMTIGAEGCDQALEQMPMPSHGCVCCVTGSLC